MAARHIIFLYGTLKSGHSNFRVLSDPKTGFAKFLGFGQTVKRYPLVVTAQYSFPFLLPVEGQGEVSRIFKQVIFQVNIFYSCSSYMLF